MNHSFLVIRTLATIILVSPITTNAELIDRGNGLIYDTAQNLTWTQNANINGKKPWHTAMAWAENLVYGGFDDWRLPKSTQFDDPSCQEDVRHISPVIFYERHFDCLGGEMEQLTAAVDPFNNPLFENVNDSRYWTGTPYRDGIDPCVEGGYCTIENDRGIRDGFYWQWSFSGVHKTTLAGGNLRYAWAVRDGDVIASDSPATLSADGNNLHIPSLFYQLINRTDNISADFTYYAQSPDGVSLWKLTGVNYNTPALSGPLTGTVSEELTLQIPKVIYQNTSYWATFEYHGLEEENGSHLWKLMTYGENQ